jgi:hypothetical protein
MYRITWKTERDGYVQRDCAKLDQLETKLKQIFNIFAPFDEKVVITIEKQ